MSNVFNETVFLKEDSYQDSRLTLLESLRFLSPYEKEELYMLRRGIAGEKQVQYHLSKANMGMYVLRDINFKYDDLRAQIDFIIVTSHHCYFVECKNYIGNIEVNKSGEFVVNSKPGKKNGRVGIKSPINQVEDQFEVFKKVCLKNEDDTKNILNGVRFKNYFKTLVVFTNHENIIKASYAPSEIREKILKVDGLVRYIQKDSDNYNGKRFNKEEMNNIANFILKNNYVVPIASEQLKREALSNRNSGNLNPLITYETNNKRNNSFRFNRNNNRSSKKKSNSLLGEIVGGILSIVAIIIILNLFTNSISKNTSQDANNSKPKIDNNLVTLTDNQKQALDIFELAYDASKTNGFTIIHTSVCYEVSKIFNNGNVCKECCNSLPIEVNFVGDKITFYKRSTNSCSTLILDDNKIVSARNEKKECSGQPVGMVEWDDNNEYYQKIGGYGKIKELSISAYKNGTFSTLNFDQAGIAGRGGDPLLYSTYVQNVNMFFSGVTGNSVINKETTKDNFEEMVESYYYIMK